MVLAPVSDDDAAAAEAHCSVDTDTGVSLAEQYTTADEYLRAGCFNPKALSASHCAQQVKFPCHLVSG